MIPLVSILIPVYNRVDLIEQTLRSALDQTHAAIEVVVVDNASTDGTWAVLTRLAEGERRLRIFKNASNLGPVRNWLACVAQARGKFCKILWSDDLMSANFIAATLPLLADRDVGFVYSAAAVFEADPTRPTVRLYDTPGAGLHPTSEFIEGALMNGDYPVSPGCAIFRTADVRKYLRLDVPNRVGSDFGQHAIGNDLLLFLLTAAHYPKFGIVGEPLSQFRAHAGSITTTSTPGRLQFHYDIAKASFVEQTKLPERLVQRFHAMLWLDLKRYDGSPYGLRTVSDFYLKREARVEFSALLSVSLARIGRKLLRTR